MSENNLAWKKFFTEKNILSTIDRKGFVYITAKEMKKIGGREPRLMAKMDTLVSRPSVFKENNLTIFPVKNGEYIIFRDEEERSYFKINTEISDLTSERYRSRINLSNFDSFSRSSQFGEFQALDYAFISSLIKNFVEEDELYLTLRGRLRSGTFKFALPEMEHVVDVNGVQIEVDSGYESNTKFVMIEAKIGKRDDFHIRQLYYPYLEWSQRTSKEIIPILFTYTNGLYYLIHFRFHPEFGNLSIVKKKCYIIDEFQKISISEQLINRIRVNAEPLHIPFIQANDLDKIIDVVSLVNEEINRGDEIADFFEFDKRQGDYYANASAYLGLIRREGQKFILTDVGRQFIHIESRSERTKFIIKQMLRVPSLRKIILYFKRINLEIDSIQKEKIKEIISEFRRELNQNTLGRRSEAIISWLKWISKNLEIQ